MGYTGVASFSCPNPDTLVTLMSIMTSMINKQSQADLESSTRLKQDEFDFIIVGAGAAGCVLANRLSENRDWSILLLEAGGEEPEEADIPALLTYNFGTRLDWAYFTQPQNTSCGGHPCYWPRGKALGGSTVINALNYNRGNRLDYDHWSELGNKGWDYKNVLPYFKKSENNLDPSISSDKVYHGVGGYLSVGRFPYQDTNVDALIRGFNELGYRTVDINAKNVRGVMAMQVTQQNGMRKSTNRAFLDPIRAQRTNLKVVTNVRATKILINERSKQAYGVEFVLEKNRNKLRKVFARNEVIVSGGTINSPQLLMHSGIGPKETLESLQIKVIKNLKVGHNLQDHVSSTAIRYLLSGKTETEPNDLEIQRDTTLYKKATRSGPWTATGCGFFGGFADSRFSDKQIDYPDVQILCRSPDSLECPSNVTKPVCYYSAISPTPVVLRPKSRGYITINTTDPFSPPLIFPNYFTEQSDLETIIDGLNLIMKLGQTQSFTRFGITLDTTPVPGCENFKIASDEYWICAVKQTTATYFHFAGTCKMGPSQDPDAVVDPQLKVYGVQGLRVIDASIIPHIVSGTLSAPTIMIAEKGADMIKQAWKRI